MASSISSAVPIIENVEFHLVATSEVVRFTFAFTDSPLTYYSDLLIFLNKFLTLSIRSTDKRENFSLLSSRSESYSVSFSDENWDRWIYITAYVTWRRAICIKRSDTNEKKYFFSIFFCPNKEKLLRVIIKLRKNNSGKILNFDQFFSVLIWIVSILTKFHVDHEFEMQLELFTITQSWWFRHFRGWIFSLRLIVTISFFIRDLYITYDNVGENN